MQAISIVDSGGTTRQASFARSSTFLAAATWGNPLMQVSPVTSSSTPRVTAVNTYDYDAAIAANAWSGTHMMTANQSGLPVAVQKIMFLKAGTAFQNTIYLDWIGGTTTKFLDLSFRDNALTSGDFTGSGTGTIPVFQFTVGPTYGGTGRALNITLLKPGRYMVSLRLLDAAMSNWTMFEMEWIVL